jgi:hypothetical protein
MKRAMPTPLKPFVYIDNYPHNTRHKIILADIHYWTMRTARFAHKATPRILADGTLALVEWDELRSNWIIWYVDTKPYGKQPYEKDKSSDKEV